MKNLYKLFILLLVQVVFVHFALSQNTDNLKSDEGFEIASTEILQGTWNSKILVFDFDDNSYKDVFVSGFGLSTGEGELFIYENSGTEFIEFIHTLPGIGNGSLCVLDYNNDGQLDLFISGQVQLYPEPQYVANLYENDNGNFSLLYEFPEMKLSAADWADVDKDGYIDLAITGYNSEETEDNTYIYHNNGDGTFTNIQTLPGVNGDLKFCDYNNDSYPDLSVSGVDLDDLTHTQIYKNTNGAFSDIEAGIQGLQKGEILWEDFNSDGLYDLLIFGDNQNFTEKLTLLYSNDGDDSFSLISTNIDGFTRGTCSSADLNNDGLPDLIFSGLTELELIGKIFINEGGFTFSASSQSIPGLRDSHISITDLDNNNTLEILISGRYDYMDYRTYLIEVSQDEVNNSPTVPSNINYSFIEQGIEFTWDDVSDDFSTNINYNVAIGSSTMSEDLTSSLSYVDGNRKFVNRGNCGASNTFIFKPEYSGQMYFKVQSIDGNGAPSSFSEEINLEFVNAEMFSVNQKIFPNPVTDILVLEFENANNYEVLICDAQGRIVNSWHINDEKVYLDMKSLKSGIYFVKVLGQANADTYKIIKL